MIKNITISFLFTLIFLSNSCGYYDVLIARDNAIKELRLALEDAQKTMEIERQGNLKHLKDMDEIMNKKIDGTRSVPKEAYEKEYQRAILNAKKEKIKQELMQEFDKIDLNGKEIEDKQKELISLVMKSTAEIQKITNDINQRLKEMSEIK